MPCENCQADLLRRAGLKVTRQRMAIPELLQEEESLTADQIFMALREKGQEFGLSTVYRALASLEEKGLVSRTELPGSSSQCFFLKSGGHRHHLICIRCRKRVLLDGCPVEAFAEEIAGRSGFVITGHSLEIFGLCPACQQENAHV